MIAPAASPAAGRPLPALRPWRSRPVAPTSVRRAPTARPWFAAADRSGDDLFDRSAWLYAFFREHLFRDDTDRIAASLWPAVGPAPGAVLLEVGCGPGLYARRLAGRFPGLRTVGVDRSPRLLEIARRRAARAAIDGCRFEQGDALALDWPDGTVDAVVASRLFTVVDGSRALAEFWRVLRPGGLCFVAEPAPGPIGSLPTLLLRAAGRLAMLLAPAPDLVPRPLSVPAPAAGAGRLAPPPAHPDAPPPLRPTLFGAEEFAALVGRPDWERVAISAAGGYRYAVCRKGA